MTLSVWGEQDQGNMCQGLDSKVDVVVVDDDNLGRGERHQTRVDADRDIGSQNKVQEVLDLYQELCIKLSLEDEGELDKVSSKIQVYIKSAMILKKSNKWLNREQTVGHVPGVQIGDRFQFMAELVVLGLHHEFISDVSYATMDGRVYAFSVVDSGRYKNKVKSSNVLIYSGQGGNAKVQAKDQKLERGNLALKNSMDAKVPVRVIRKVEVEGDKKIYVYDGLYNVMRFSCDRDEAGKAVFLFEMVQVEGQPDCDHYNIRKQKRSIEHMETRSVILEDLSKGKERYTVNVVNELSDEKPKPFTYITQMLGLHLHKDPIPRGCQCIGGCSDDHQCTCVRKNGGEIPFNEDGAIIDSDEGKKIYECGPRCRCPPSCQNRSSQHGPKIPLEVFKTKTMGWGVRAREDIKIGSFICEYLGEIIGDGEANKREEDEYLYDLKSGLTIDPAKFGNVSRFLNHACSPNLIAREVFYDNGNEKLPHVMFFALNDIPALSELTLDYNYKLDSVVDDSGNIMVKDCFCGTEGCRGRLY